MQRGTFSLKATVFLIGLVFEFNGLLMLFRSRIPKGAFGDESNGILSDMCTLIIM